jgi:hypothetical protein
LVDPLDGDIEKMDKFSKTDSIGKGGSIGRLSENYNQTREKINSHVGV